MGPGLGDLFEDHPETIIPRRCLGALRRKGAAQSPLPVCFMGSYPEIRAILCTKEPILTFFWAHYGPVQGNKR